MEDDVIKVDDISADVPLDIDVFKAERTNELITRVNYCEDKGQWLNTLDVDQILQVVQEEDGVQIFPTYSPVDHEDLPFYAKYVKIEKVDISSRILVIPLCDGNHFNGYVVNLEKNEVVKIDSMNPTADETPIYKVLRNELFELTDEVCYFSYFPSKVQFDSASCSIWLVMGIVCYLMEIPSYSHSLTLENAYNVVYTLLNKSESLQQKLDVIRNLLTGTTHNETTSENVENLDFNKITPECSNTMTDATMHESDDSGDNGLLYSSSKFIIDELEKGKASEYFKSKPVKGVRSTYFYVCDTGKNSLDDIYADDNGAYAGSRSKKEVCYKDGDCFRTAKQDENGNYFYNKKINNRKYEKVPISTENVVILHRYYRSSKNFSLKRIVSTLSYPDLGKNVTYVGVAYLCKKVSEGDPIMSHGNSTTPASLVRPYIRTSKEILRKGDELLTKGFNVRKVYDSLTSLSGGPLRSESQGQEPRNMKQIRNRKALLDKGEVQFSSKDNTDEISSALLFKDMYPGYVRTVSAQDDNYIIFLATDKQIQDVKKFCCRGNSVLSVDTTFNLCDLWLTDTSFKNERLINSSGNHPIFLGPCFLHFRKDEATFSRFFFEMISLDPEIIELGKIGTDLDMAIYNGFSILARNIGLLLCVYHLKTADKRKLSDLCKGNELSQSDSKSIINDIYGTKYGSIQEYGLADSKNKEELHAKLSALHSKWDAICPGFHK